MDLILKEYCVSLCDYNETTCPKKSTDTPCMKAHDLSKLRRNPFS